jgi:hypothetical protein
VVPTSANSSPATKPTAAPVRTSDGWTPIPAVSKSPQ